MPHFVQEIKREDKAYIKLLSLHREQGMSKSETNWLPRQVGVNRVEGTETGKTRYSFDFRPR